jgi:hypothetical protein
VCFWRIPDHSAADLRHRVGDENPAPQHVEVLNSQSRHLAPAQPGVRQEADHRCTLATDLRRQSAYLLMAQVAAALVLPAGRLDPGRRINGQLAVLDGRLQDTT